MVRLSKGIFYYGAVKNYKAGGKEHLYKYSNIIFTQFAIFQYNMTRRPASIHIYDAMYLAAIAAPL